MRNYLKRHLETLKKRFAAESAKLDNAATVEEIRAIDGVLKELRDQIDEVEKKLADTEGDDGDGQGAEGSQGQEPQEPRSAAPAAPVNGLREFRQVGQYQQQPAQAADPTDTVEYRTAFMNFVCRGVAIPRELRADAVTTTTDASAVIPTSILHEIVKETKAYGEIYAKVRHLNVQGGVQIPILSLKPTATWITANTGTSESDKQKIQANTYISFGYFGLECKVAQTLLANVTTLDIFQQEFVKLASEAMVQAMEVVIFKGTGNGQPLGILNDTRVPAANVITMTAEEFETWSAWCKKVFGAMKKAYRTGSFIMAQGTFDGYINGMVDSNGQPIGRVNYGITDGETYRFGGKEVLTVEDDVLPNYDSAASGDVVAVFIKLSDYGVNSNMQMKVVKWEDHDTNEIKNKCILICDGKLIDPNGVLLIKKG